MNHWPHYQNFDISHFLEHWELNGIREWAYRSEQYQSDVAWYIAHQLTPAIEDILGVPLIPCTGIVDVYKNGQCKYPVLDLSNSCIALTFLVAISKQESYDFNYSFADGILYSIKQKDNWNGFLFDNNRILSGYGSLFQGKRAVAVTCRWMCRAIVPDTVNKHIYKTQAYRKHDGLVQSGGCRIQHAFDQSYSEIVTQLFPEDELTKLAAMLHADTVVRDATVRESCVVNTKIRKTSIGWIPYDKYPKLKEALDKGIASVLSAVTPQFDTLEQLYKPSLQYTVYQEGDYYDWHQDGDMNFFKKRHVSFVLMLELAKEGGMLEIENYGEVKLNVGDMVVFPSYKRHRVTEVRKSVRRTLVGWLEVKS